MTRNLWFPKLKLLSSVLEKLQLIDMGLQEWPVVSRMRGWPIKRSQTISAVAFADALAAAAQKRALHLAAALLQQAHKFVKLSRKKLINDRFMGHSILHLKLEAYDLRTYLKDHDDMNYSARPPTSSRPLKIPLDYPIKSLIKTNFYALNERQ